MDPEFSRIRGSLRKGAWFNLLDYALAANVERVLIVEHHHVNFARLVWPR